MTFVPGMEETRSPNNLGELKEWVTWKMEGAAKDRGKSGTEARKDIEKLWSK